MSPKRPTFLLAELPGALYEHMLLTMDGSSSSKFRAMFTLECTAKACRIPSSVWRDVVLACLKEIKDVEKERMKERSTPCGNLAAAHTHAQCT